jgi:nucleoside 2-deoxyribosyltransferase
MIKSIYLIGSLRNQEIPVIGDTLRAEGFDAFDEWHSAGKEADDEFQAYRLGRGLSYRQALNTYAAKHIFSFDKYHLDRCDAAVLVMPAGKSGHLEAGYMAGTGKPVFVLFNGEPERFDQMYQFCTDVCFSVKELIDAIKAR